MTEMEGGVSTYRLDACGTGDQTESLEMDWSYSSQASRKHYATSLNLELRGETEKRMTEKHVAPRAIWKQKSMKLHTARDNWIGWLRTGMPGGIMLAVYP